jgi:hypothetical protein
MSKRVLPALAMAAVLAGGFAAAQAPRAVAGSWSGAYTCSQGLTGMTLELRPLRGDAVDATVIFYAHPRNPAVASGCYGARGALDRATGQLTLRPTRWILRPDENWSMTTLDGRIDATGAYTGRVVFVGRPSACTTFALRRGAAPLTAPPAACTTPAPMS